MLRNKLSSALQAALLGSALFLSGSAFALTAGTTQTPAIAAPQNPTDSANEAFLARLSAQLNLTKDQQTKVRAIMSAARPQFKDYMSQLAKTQQGLYDAVNGPTYDQAQVKKFAAQQGALVTKIIIARADMHHQLMAVLTPQQRQTLQTLLQQQTTQMQAMGAPEQPQAAAPVSAPTAPAKNS